MKKQTKLFLQMDILFLIVFVAVGVIVVNEKTSNYKIPRVKEKMVSYLGIKFDSTNFYVSDVKYNALKYTAKIIDKNYDDLYFYIYYEDKKLSDSYQKDYIEGSTFLKNKEKEISNYIKKQTKNNYQVNIKQKLNEFSQATREEILTSTTPWHLEIYSLNANISVTEFNSKKIAKTIENFINNLSSKNITPTSYNFTVSCSDEKSNLEISNITVDLIKNNTLENRINDIIRSNKNK